MGNAAQRPRYAYVRRGLLAAALILAGSCDSTELLKPGTDPRVQFDHDAPQPEVSGDYFAASPPANDPWTGATWTSTGIEIPANVWVKLDINGGVSISANSEYTTYYCGSCVPYAGMTAGPFGVGNSYLRLELRVKHASGAVTGVGFAGDPNGTQAVAFIKLTTAGVLETSRRFIPGGGSCMFSRPPGYTKPGPCPHQTDYHHAHAYNLGGGQSISAKSIRPMEVHADKTEALPGETVSFNAVAGAPFIYLSWFFAPGDTLDQPRNQYGPFRACADNSMPCNYKPATSGRMYASATLQGGVSVVAHSQVVRITPDAWNLGVSADKNEVDAGEEVTFTATVNPSDASITEWRWQPDGGPAAVVCAPALICKMNVQTSGTMTVKGTKGSSQKTASASVTAHNRTCSDADITLVDARGPNAEGSFTTHQNENTIRMQATLSENCRQYTVKWEVTDHPGDEVSVRLPASVPDGETVTWRVPPHDTARYGRVHPGQLDEKALIYRVRAYFDDDKSVRHWTPARLVGQTVVDVIREEYVEYRKQHILAPAELGVWRSTYFDADELNHGDYDIFPASQRMRNGMDAFRDNMRDALETPRRPFPGLTLTSSFRNPVHHHRHVGATSREGQHLYGKAADVRIHNLGLSREDAWEEMRIQARKTNVLACYEPERVVRAANSAGILTHFHLDWRDVQCPPAWRR